MGIEQICKTIGNFFSNIRPPFPQMSRLLLICSMVKRPGLSTIQSVANITKDLNKLGIPTGPMPDGSANLTIAFALAMSKETYRAMKEDASIQVGIQPGSIAMTGFGANQGGPMTIKGINTSPGQGFANLK